MFQAYYLLEARRRIRAQPRSGYFVATTAKRRADAPETSRPSAATTEVKVSELIFNLLEATRDADIVPLGSAFPSAKLFPLARLSRSLAAGMRELDPARIVLELSPGNPTLRRQIALRDVVDGLAVEMPEIVITHGAMEALNLCLQATLVSLRRQMPVHRQPARS